MPGEKRHCHRLAAANGDLAGQFRLRMLQFPFGLVGQLHDLLRAPAQEHPVIRQHNAVLATSEKLHAQLRLQLHQLAGERRLRHMEQRRRLRDILLPRHGEKVTQNSQFHPTHLIRRIS